MRHDAPTGFGYANSPNFNELYAKRMAELDAIIPKPKRKPRIAPPAEPTAHGYATAIDNNARVAAKLASLNSGPLPPRPRRAARQPKPASR